MLKKLLSFLFFMGLLAPAVFAQTGTIKGTVTNANTGKIIIGANVYIKSVQRGVATDTQGGYRIENLDPGTYTLRISYIGYKTIQKRLNIGNGVQTVDFQLNPTTSSLASVVVTAQGIKRRERSLGYSVSTVQGEAISSNGQTDVTRTLKGKVPGANITQTSGVEGTATNFIIRGYSTISGGNQPLFIVDGVEFNTTTNSSSNFLDGGALSESSRFLDLDPNNIKSVNVLKGLSATTIYGAKGRNGVVIINTKSGSFNENKKPGFEVSLSQSFFADKIASLPDYQDTYGAGFHQNLGFFFSNWGPAFDADVSDNPLFIRRGADGTNIIKSPFSQFSDPALRAAFPSYQKGGDNYEYPYIAYPDAGNFFRTGLQRKSNINISGSSSGVNVNLSVSNANNEGFTPGNKVIKNNVGLGIQTQVFDRLTIKTTANLALTDMKTPPIAYSNGSSARDDSRGSVFGDVFYTPRSINLIDLPSENPVDNSSVYYRSGNDIQNPFWTANHEKSIDNVDRIYGRTSASYDIIEGVNVTYKLGLDTYSEDQDFQLSKGNVTNAQLTDGYYQTRTLSNTIWDNNLYVQFDKDLTSSISLNGVAGGQYVLTKFSRDGLASRNQIIFGLFEHGNFRTPSASNFFSNDDFQFHSRQETAGVYADANLGYNDYIYLDLSARNDWFSTLEPEHNSKFYPSASVSFIPTDAFNFGGSTFNYLKLRLGIGTSAGPPNVYRTRSTLSSTPRAFINNSGEVVTANAISNRLGNRDLKPELQTEYEAGVEARFFDSRIDFNFSAYHRLTRDLITDAQLDPATGFTRTATNVGELETNGIGAKLGGVPIRRRNFQWNTNFNFSTYASTVNDLGVNLSSIALSGFTNLGNFAEEGEPLNIIKGSAIKRDEQGRRLVNSSGEYIESDEIQTIGNPNPKYNLTNINTFRYKGFSLTSQIDYTHGGDIYSTTISTLLARGETTDTDFDRQVPVVLPGFKQNGEPNDIQISSTQAYFGNLGLGPDEAAVYDATVLRLSELSLSYNLPVALIGNTPIKDLSITLSGFNLWYFTPNIPEGTNFDPNTVGTGADNGLGFDFLNGPSARRFGGTISVKF